MARQSVYGFILQVRRLGVAQQSKWRRRAWKLNSSNTCKGKITTFLLLKAELIEYMRGNDYHLFALGTYVVELIIKYLRRKDYHFFCSWMLNSSNK
jgi:hypothetical protein